MKKYRMEDAIIDKYESYIDPALNSTDGSCEGQSVNSDSDDEKYSGNYY